MKELIIKNGRKGKDVQKEDVKGEKGAGDGKNNSQVAGVKRN